ncbi:MAG TPA: transcription termination factor NusA [Clostridia bacterium]|nr:transcription termination factor NusA [Clostridia bacterium]
MSSEIIEILNQIERDKGIKKELIVEAIVAALESAYKKNYNMTKNSVRVDFDIETGDVKVFSLLHIVEEPIEVNDITMEEAKEFPGSHELGDIIEEEVTPKDFGRIAAQNARQVIIQRIKEEEREVLFNKFANRESEMITGKIQRESNGVYFITLGSLEGVLLPNEQIMGETYEQGMRLKCIIKSVSQTTKGPQIILSRTDADLVKRLFELEVPEIYDGVVEIRSIAREAGARTKMAVFTLDSTVDSLGACVGKGGVRVNAVVDELGGEKIDIVKWHKDPEVYIANALSPADVIKVEILDESNKTARVIVPDDQLSLAIGKAGQNARLSAKLTGWKIDIKSLEQSKALKKEKIESEEKDVSIESKESEENASVIEE